jgi:hypothetical protein
MRRPVFGDLFYRKVPLRLPDVRNSTSSPVRNIGAETGAKGRRPSCEISNLDEQDLDREASKDQVSDRSLLPISPLHPLFSTRSNMHFCSKAYVPSILLELDDDQSYRIGLTPLAMSFSLLRDVLPIGSVRWKMILTCRHCGCRILLAVLPPVRPWILCPADFPDRSRLSKLTFHWV